MGGHGGLFLAFRHSDKFSACGSTSGALHVTVITKGYGVVQSTSVGGAVAISAGNAATSQVVGVAPEATVDTKYNQILLDVK